jgi:hypothetical protein
MKKPIIFLARIAAVGALAVLAQNAQAQTLYQLTADDTGYSLPVNNGDPAGNEVVLAGTAASDLISSFAFQFSFLGNDSFATPNGSEAMDITFYQNNGLPFNSYATPNTVLWDSTPFTLASIGLSTYTPGQIITYTGIGVVVPKDFTWAVTFTGLSSDETAGLAIYGQPPTVGSNYGDAWVYDPSNPLSVNGWVLDVSSSPAPPLAFGAEIDGTPVPDSSCLSISVMAVLMVFGWVKRFQRNV